MSGPGSSASRPAPTAARSGSKKRVSIWTSIKLGFGAGLVSIFCCVGPTVLFFLTLGLLSASTAVVLANYLYDTWKLLFISIGLIALVVGLVIHFRSRGVCTIAAAKRQRRAIMVTALIALIVAMITYAVMYQLTTWLGNLV